MVLLDPVFHALQHILSHERLFGSRLVAAAGAVGISAVGGLAVEIVGIDALEVAVLNVEGVVVDHVEDDPDASLVQRLHHLLELPDAHFRMEGFGGVAAFRHVVVLRVVAPVVLRHGELRLVDGGEVERRQDMYGVDAELSQIVDGPWLREGKELAAVYELRRWVDGEVAVVQLIDDEVCRRLHAWSFVGIPSLGVRAAHVDDGSAVSHGLCEKSRTFAVARVEGVEHAAEISVNGGLPFVLTGAFHRDGPGGIRGRGALVDAQRWCGG